MDENNTKMKMPEESFSSVQGEDKAAHLGAILGILIVILVLILGGLYVWGSTMSKNPAEPKNNTIERPTAEENNEPESTNAEAEVDTLGALSTSNEIDAIQADIDSTDLSNLNAELNAIEAEINAALE